MFEKWQKTDGIQVGKDLSQVQVRNWRPNYKETQTRLKKSNCNGPEPFDMVAYLQLQLSFKKWDYTFLIVYQVNPRISSTYSVPTVVGHI